MLNQPEPMTFVYQADGDDGVAAINRALDDIGFRAAEAQAAGLGAASRQDPAATLLTGALLGQVEHDQDWAREVAGLLGG